METKEERFETWLAKQRAKKPVDYDKKNATRAAALISGAHTRVSEFQKVVHRMSPSECEATLINSKALRSSLNALISQLEAAHKKTPELTIVGTSADADNRE